MDPTDFEKVEDWFASRIDTVSGDPYAKGAGTKFKLSKIPLTTIQDASSIAHLLYNVWIPTAPNSGLNRGRDTTNTTDGTVWIEASVIVQFTFKLNAAKQIKGQRRAGHASVAVMQAIMAQQTATEKTAYGCIVVDLVDAMRIALTADGHYVLIEQEYTAGFDVLVSRAS